MENTKSEGDDPLIAIVKDGMSKINTRIGAIEARIKELFEIINPINNDWHAAKQKREVEKQERRKTELQDAFKSGNT